MCRESKTFNGKTPTANFIIYCYWMLRQREDWVVGIAIAIGDGKGEGMGGVDVNGGGDVLGEGGGGGGGGGGVQAGDAAFLKHLPVLLMEQRGDLRGRPGPHGGHGGGGGG